MTRLESTAEAIARNEGMHWGLNQNDDQDRCPFDDRFPELRDAWVQGFEVGRKLRAVEDKRLKPWQRNAGTRR